jgi:hypothetical protein
MSWAFIEMGEHSVYVRVGRRIQVGFGMERREINTLLFRFALLDSLCIYRKTHLNNGTKTANERDLVPIWLYAIEGVK